jgi:hypothetical protein
VRLISYERSGGYLMIDHVIMFERMPAARPGESAAVPGVAGSVLGKNLGGAIRGYDRSVTTGHIRVDVQWTPSTVEGSVR